MVIIVGKVLLLDLLAYSDKGSLVNNSLIQDSIEMGDVIVKCTKHPYTKSFIHNILLHYVLTWWLALSHLDALLVLKNPYSVMVCSSMLTKTFFCTWKFFRADHKEEQCLPDGELQCDLLWRFLSLLSHTLYTGTLFQWPVQWHNRFVFFHHRLDPLFKHWLWKRVLHLVWALYYVYRVVEVTLNMAK